MAGQEFITIKQTNSVEQVAKVLAEEGYLTAVEKQDKELKVTLKYNKKGPVVMGIRRVSKPGARVYTGIKELPKVWGGLGKSVLSTPKGIISEKMAKKEKVGGEIICQVW